MQFDLQDTGIVTLLQISILQRTACSCELTLSSELIIPNIIALKRRNGETPIY